MVENPPGNERDSSDMGLIPGSKDSLEVGNGNPLQDSCLRNPMDRGAWQATLSPWGRKESDMTKQLSTHIKRISGPFAL